MSDTPRTRAVREITDIVTAWIPEYAASFDSFRGAMLWGGITALNGNEAFDARRDVDVILFLGADREKPDSNDEILRQGLMIEVGFMLWDTLSDLPSVLRNPHRAANVAAGRIVADPDGRLADVATSVRQEYAERRWVDARLEAVREEARARIHGAADRGAEGWFHVTNCLSSMLAVASLMGTTYRRSLSVLGDIASRHGRTDIYSRCVALMGFDHLSAGDVEEYLRQAAEAFDYALTVKRTDVPHGFKLVPHLRPYMVDITRETLRRGDPSGAMMWVLVTYSIAVAAIQNDTPEPERTRFLEALAGLKRDIGMYDEAMVARTPLAKALADDVHQFATEIVAGNPRIQ